MLPANCAPNACCLALRLPVAAVEDPRAERARLGQLEIDPLLKRGEVARAGAEHDRADEQPVLVDQAVPHQGRGQARAADGEIPSRLLLQLGDLRGCLAAGERGVALDLLE